MGRATTTTKTQRRAERAPAARAKARAKPAEAKTKAQRRPAEANTKARGKPAGKQARAHEIGLRLARAMPEPRCELDFRTGWELLVATILSAQSTDRTVNRVTPLLFAAYPTPAALASAALEDVERIVHPTGFFRNKAKAIVAASRELVARYPNEAATSDVPKSLDALVELHGVARKTANLVIGTAYGVATGFIVDTHAGRVARRLGLTASEAPDEVERDLCALFPASDWVAMGHRFVLHGRYQCVAKGPRCASCPLAELCPAVEAPSPDSWEERAAAEGALVSARGT